MKSVAIKKGQIQEKVAGLREMGTLRCDGCGENFSLVTIQHSRIRGSLKYRQLGSKRLLQKSTSGTRNMRTESNCLNDLHKPGHCTFVIGIQPY